MINKNKGGLIMFVAGPVEVCKIIEAGQHATQSAHPHSLKRLTCPYRSLIPSESQPFGFWKDNSVLSLLMRSA